MDEITKTRWQTLVDLFGLAKQGTRPWDADTLAENFKGASHGEMCTIRFLLNVWDPGRNWSCGKFDVIEACRTWDHTQREAFLSWANDPWFP
jgi:hypothetical protein